MASARSSRSSRSASSSGSSSHSSIRAPALRSIWASFQAWAGDLAAEGPRRLLRAAVLPRLHPRLSLCPVRWSGWSASALGGIGDLIKIPPILADVAIGWLVWSMARELGAGRRAALIGAALVVANPVSWFDSVLWGQVDSFGVVFLLLGLRALWRDRPERAAIYTVIAALIKPQLAILAPIVAVVTIRRALWPTATPDEPGDDLREAAWQPRRPRRFRAWERRTDHPIRILTTGVAGFLTAVVLCFPFGLSVIEPGTNGQLLHSGLVEQIFKTAGGYPYASVNAYNPWALASVDGTGIAQNSGWACDTIILNPRSRWRVLSRRGDDRRDPRRLRRCGPAGARLRGRLPGVAWRPTPPTMLTGLAILAIAFFILPTRVHERYLYPFVAIGAILAAVSVRWRIAYVVLSATTFLNMYVVLTTLYPGNPGIKDWLGIGARVRSRRASRRRPDGARRLDLGVRPAPAPGDRRARREIEAARGRRPAADEAEPEDGTSGPGPASALPDDAGRRWPAGGLDGAGRAGGAGSPP